jgi:hypothetical protein
MPALNTPQFGWVRSRLPRRAQPVPPIYEPEVGAEAVYWAAHHDRRELAVGWSTLLAMWGQKFVPGLLDRYLGRTGYTAQQHDGPETDRADNLFSPVPGDYAAHGSFDARAEPRTTALWPAEHAAWLAAGGIGLTLALLLRRR